MCEHKRTIHCGFWAIAERLAIALNTSYHTYTWGSAVCSVSTWNQMTISFGSQRLHYSIETIKHLSLGKWNWDRAAIECHSKRVKSRFQSTDSAGHFNIHFPTRQRLFSKDYMRQYALVAQHISFISIKCVCVCSPCLSPVHTSWLHSMDLLLLHKLSNHN